MNREDINQRVLDVLGVILVDKSALRDDVAFEDLVLDEQDINELFGRLEEEFGFAFPASIRERAIHKPEHLSLPVVVDLIVLMRQV
ncbi:hypothetical protein [Pseudomonas cichorii]|uniref:hypothetical protein n=1 Tax=Pseudomonas cichorii TaxID=36746 RepID=UPI001C8AC9B9|nr:hypothetical protein [Pseudomonas cichorii]MBX8529056.1 hypothetical protein [Pseudomonas cichorii]MBX8573340.1 hypothetical protein [Pseudomonas cichorii]